MRTIFLSTLLLLFFAYTKAQTTSNNHPNFTLTAEGTCICATASNIESGTFFTGTPNEITYTKRTWTELDALIVSDATNPDITLTCTKGIKSIFGLILNTQFSEDIFSGDICNKRYFTSWFSLAMANKYIHFTLT